MSRLETLLKEAQSILDGERDPNAALAKAQNALILAPTNPDVWLMMGQAYGRMERFVDALDCFSSAMKHSPGSTEVIQLRRADMYLQTGNPSEAIQEYRSVLSVNPSNVPARTGLAGCLLNSGDLDRARQEFETAIQDGKGAYWFRHDLERCYEGLSRTCWKKGMKWEAVKAILKGFWCSVSYRLGVSYFP